jgi:hypothetical protein
MFMIQVINSYLAITINHYYIYNIINHRDLKFMDHKNMASAIGLDGVELAQFIMLVNLKNYRYQE